MAQNDMLRRYLDAGMALTQITQQRAEAIVRDLVKAGEVQTEQAQQVVEDLLDRSRKNTEHMLETVRKEIRDQARNLGLATQADIAALRREIAALRGTGGAAAAKKAGATQAPAKKTAAKKTGTKKTGTKKSTAKKAAPRKS